MKKEVFKKHLGILLLGFVSALKGTIAAAMAVAAAGLFYCIPIESGYLAVSKFVAGIFAALLALIMFYWCGRDLVKGKFLK